MGNPPIARHDSDTMTREERDVPVMSGLDAIISCCRQELWQYVLLPSISAVQITVETSSAFLTCFCEARDADQQIACYTRFSVKAPPGRRAAVAEFVHRANWNLAIGCFEFNQETGEVRFRTSLDLDQESLAPQLIRPLIRHALFTADHYHDGFLRVAVAGVEPADAIEQLELYTVDDVVHAASMSLDA
jgi:hypothetical protein